MIPNTKISHTILMFGKAIFNELPDGYSKSDFEIAISIVLAVWNAITIDAWNGNMDFEAVLLKAFESEQEQTKLKIKQLIERKKRHFSGDLRAVGNHWVRDNNGELVFGCDARANINALPVSTTIQ